MQTVSIHTFSAVSADPIRRQILLKFHELVLIRLIRAFEFDANCFDTYLFCIHRPSMLLLFSLNLLFWIFWIFWMILSLACWVLYNWQGCHV